MSTVKLRGAYFGIGLRREVSLPIQHQSSSIELYICSKEGEDRYRTCNQRGPEEGEVGSGRDVQIESPAATGPC